MKWVLLVLAGFSLYVCWQLGQPLNFRSDTVNEAAGMIALAGGMPAYIGMIMAGLIGAVSVVGAAKIQVSENKHKD